MTGNVDAVILPALLSTNNLENSHHHFARPVVNKNNGKFSKSFWLQRGKQTALQMPTVTFVPRNNFICTRVN